MFRSPKGTSLHDSASSKPLCLTNHQMVVREKKKTVHSVKMQIRTAVILGSKCQGHLSKFLNSKNNCTQWNKREGHPLRSDITIDCRMLALAIIDMLAITIRSVCGRCRKFNSS